MSASERHSAPHDLRLLEETLQVEFGDERAEALLRDLRPYLRSRDVKTREVIDGDHFPAAVEAAIADLYPDGNGELPALAVRRDPHARSVLVATPLGVLDCTLDLTEPLEGLSTSRPIRTRLIRWDDWPHTSLTAVTFPVGRDVFETEWHITGIDDLVTGDEPSRQPRELSDFARECTERQLGRSLAEA